MAPYLFTGRILDGLTRHPEQNFSGLHLHGPSAFPGPPCPFGRAGASKSRGCSSRLDNSSRDPAQGTARRLTAPGATKRPAAPASCPIVSPGTDRTRQGCLMSGLRPALTSPLQSAPTRTLQTCSAQPGGAEPVGDSVTSW